MGVIRRSARIVTYGLMFALGFYAGCNYHDALQNIKEGIHFGRGASSSKSVSGLESTLKGNGSLFGGENGR